MRIGYEAILPALISFAVTAVLVPLFIPWMQRKKVSQTERELGVEAHLKKAGTPTMGGVTFLIGITIASLFFVFRFPRILPVLLVTLAFGAIGFADDYLKVIKHDSDGLLPWQKFLLQFLIIVCFGVYMRFFSDVTLAVRLPFAGGKTVALGILAYPLLLLAFGGTVNGVNFTDGIDGLASSVTATVALTFTIASTMLDGGIAPVSAAVTGGLLAFLLFNAYPAKVFMGDTGSLALGGFVIASAYMLQMPLFIIIIGFIYLIEVLSVILQVGYFKLTHGKRIFKMAPIHHHFELSGWSETRVVACFTVVTALLSMLAIWAL